MRSALALAFGVVTIAACQDFAVAPDPIAAPVSEGGIVDAGVDVDAVAPPSLPFSICPGLYSGACATVEMPLDWSNEAGKKVNVLIDKIVSTTTVKKQIWLLQGGPGGSGADMVEIGREVARRNEGMEVFTLEHRGVGASNRLGCPKLEAQGKSKLTLAACAEEAKALYGSDLLHYTTTNAAKDLARAIELTRRENVPVYVYGVSYGTYWAQRFMQVAPKHATGGVILDSIVTPGQQFLSNFDPQGDLAAKKVAELCKVDPTCSAQMGPDPWGKISATFEKLKQGHCAASGINLVSRAVLTNFLRNWATTGYALAAIHRLDRCSPADVQALSTLLSRDIFTSPTDRLFSQILYIDVAFSELWENPTPTDEEMKKRFDETIFASGGGLELPPVFKTWPKYPRDAFVDKLPTPEVPVLVLNGTLDTQTPIELAEKSRATYTGPSMFFASVPNANHGVIIQSPVPTGIPGQYEACGMKILDSFLLNSAAVDATCATQVAPPPFTRPLDEVSYLFGTNDLWTGVRVPPPKEEPPSVAMFRKIARTFPPL